MSAELSTRLSRIMSERVDSDMPRNLSVGRMGELYVYHRLMELVRRHRERHSNFDQMVDLEFPTGHPILGVGRIVRCHWANADIESRRPFDLDIDVQGKWSPKSVRCMHIMDLFIKIIVPCFV
ncbi:unnamed protein product [Echinostoma caproni]|uniref:Uncharacterized protein n=1 Tax=Echinostoma caproni TaxID=27848 RepID=A0A183A410_9TREM|nr:unnamed protein product [Echinostoma caproni]